MTAGPMRGPWTISGEGIPAADHDAVEIPRRHGDLIELYGTLADATAAMKAAADSVYAAHLMGASPWYPLTDAVAAADRVKAAVAEYQQEGVS